MHAHAYNGLPDMQFVGVCDLDRERAQPLAREMNVPAYDSAERMLQELSPHIVHVVVPPQLPRGDFIRQAAAAGAAAVVIEKPIALLPSHFADLIQVNAETNIKVIVSHQRRYFANAQLILGRLPELGTIHFVRGSSQGWVMDMVTHVIDFMQMLTGDLLPDRVMATIWGARSYKDPRRNGPDNLIANLAYPNGTRGLLEVADPAFGVADFTSCTPRCNVDAWGSNGRAWIRQEGEVGWGFEVMGMQPLTGRSTWKEDTAIGQRTFTTAIKKWLEDENSPHGCRLEKAITSFRILLMAFNSALKGRPTTPADSFSDEDLDSLQAKVFAAAENRLGG